MSRLTFGRSLRLRARRGLTMVELLVVMVMLAIVGGAMTRVMVKQQQYYKDQARSVSARRELRLGATIMPAEMRSISTSGGDILAMSENEITMRASIGSGVICARGGAGSNVIYVPPTNLARHTLTNFPSTPIPGDRVFLYNDSTLKGSEDDVWTDREILTVEKDLAACPGLPYTDPALDPPALKPRYRFTLSAPLPDSVRVGAVARFVRRVRYKIYQESSGAWYLGVQENQGGSWGSWEPLAGPYRPYASGDGNGSGLQFRYYDTLGVRLTNYALTKDVGRIDVRLRTNAGIAAVTERQGRDLKDSVVMRVAIRNSK